MAVLDGPRTLLPFAQIGNWKFLIDGFALYMYMYMSLRRQMTDQPGAFLGTGFLISQLYQSAHTHA